MTTSSTDLLFDYARCLSRSNCLDDCDLLLSLAPDVDIPFSQVSDSSRKALLAICLACCEAENQLIVQKHLLPYLLSFTCVLHKFNYTQLNNIYAGCKPYALSALENFSFILNDSLSFLTTKCTTDFASQIGICQITLAHELISEITENRLSGKSKFIVCSVVHVQGE
ncbi:hypothetical protein GJ496_004074 [Pomphorhynchus laevis]|nr:hypothetical protein GJ496_004074 [Pomphorhynchus laevis]